MGNLAGDFNGYMNTGANPEDIDEIYSENSRTPGQGQLRQERRRKRYLAQMSRQKYRLDRNENRALDSNL